MIYIRDIDGSIFMCIPNEEFHIEYNCIKHAAYD